MPEAVLAIDAGTTSVTALVVGAEGGILGRAKGRFPIAYPGPGRVEQDAEALWVESLRIAQAALSDASLSAGDVAAIGVTSQRASCVVWERATGRAVSPLVSWQDLRGVERAGALGDLGYPLLPQSAACKLEGIVDEIPDGRARVERGELAWGNLDSYLVWRLSGGAVHATDRSQGCATGYFDFESGAWNRALVDLQGLREEFFPALVDTRGVVGCAERSLLGGEIPIAAIVGDQQGAAIAQGCFEVGEGKVTYGTSGTCDVCTGAELVQGAAAYPLVLMSVDGETSYAVEGMVITAGAMFEWLVDGLGILGCVEDSEGAVAGVADSDGVFVLPALQGLGTPHADWSRRALIGGLTRATTKAYIVRAAMEGLAYRVREMLDGIYSDGALPRSDSLRVDGGASANNALMQIQADVLGVAVERMRPIEASAFGAGLLAGQAVGMWSAGDVAGLRKVDRTFEPSWSEDERDERFEWWRRSCGVDT